MLLGRSPVNLSKVGGDNAELLALEASDNLSNKTALNTVGLNDYKSTVHDMKI